MRKSLGLNTNIVTAFNEWHEKKSEFEELGELLEEETDSELREEAHKDQEVTFALKVIKPFIASRSLTNHTLIHVYFLCVFKCTH